jgi:hypothetical protein
VNEHSTGSLSLIHGAHFDTPYLTFLSMHTQPCPAPFHSCDEIFFMAEDMAPRPLSRFESQAKKEAMEQQNFQHAFAWMQADDEEEPDQALTEEDAECEGIAVCAPQREEGTEENGADLDFPSSMSDYWARNRSGRGERAQNSRLGTAPSNTSSRPGSRRLRHTHTHQFYRDHVVDKRRHPARTSHDPRPSTAPQPQAKVMFTHTMYSHGQQGARPLLRQGGASKFSAELRDIEGRGNGQTRSCDSDKVAESTTKRLNF